MKVGIVDSGAGGLTILNAIQQKLPFLDLVYLADDAFAPYGSKSIVQLQDRLIKIGSFFETEGVAAIVVACNTATVAAIDALRSNTKLPVIGVEPAVKPAFRMSKKRNVAVLATPLTAASTRLNQLIELWQADSQVSIMASPTLAFDIDAWPESKEKVIETIKVLSQTMLADEVDTLVLACTHYPLVKSLFEQELGQGCEIIEPSEGVTAQLLRKLQEGYPEQIETQLESRTKGKVELCSSLGLAGTPRLVAWVQCAETVVDQRHALIP
ncbi:glutamate racemase [Marinomonas transparens]|uniref:Glutamate racemase n=1 Tax=Marinomonas transparens TaxID=2795388 RepID=A0A934N6K9_9GAMM|nr:glutamate racemase [Marinomonas transparens]MBJ7538151.1 glutamate racemase [Marinomonas transparens]